MSGWYQQAPEPRSGSRRSYLFVWLGWLALSPVLMWYPGSGGPGWAWLGPAGAAFHALWFGLGSWLLLRAGSTLTGVRAWLGLVVLGVIFEIGQGFIPGRDPSLLDGTLNAVGAAVGLWLAGPRPDPSTPASGLRSG